MEAILTSSNKMQSELFRFHCKGKEQSVFIQSEQNINQSVRCCILDLSGKELCCDEGNFFESCTDYELSVKLGKPGIYIVRITVDQQNFVETLYNL